MSAEPEPRLLDPATDPHAVDWLLDELRDDHTVGSLVPTSFAAYARVFHPARRGDDGQAVRWSDVAAANGRKMHSIAEWGSLIGSWQLECDPEGMWHEPPPIGTLEPDVADRLAEVLANHTTMPARCWFGGLESTIEYVVAYHEDVPPEEVERLRRAHEAERRAREKLNRVAPRFKMRDLHMLLLEGPLSAAGAPDLLQPFELGSGSPSLWWPEDRAWCVSTNTDLMTTYVGGSLECVEAICSTPALEALPASVDQHVTWDSDALNPLPAPPY